MRKDVLLYLWLCRTNGLFGGVRHWKQEPIRWRLGRTQQPEDFPFCSVPVTVPLLISLVVVLLTLIWRLAGRTSAEPDYTYLFHLYLGAILLISLWAPETIMRQVINYVNTAENIDYRSPELWKALKRPLREQLIFMVVGAALALFTVRFLYETIYQEAFFTPLALPAVLIGALWGVGGYTALWNGAAFANYMQKAGFRIFPLDPRRSPDIMALSRLFETVLLVNSVALFVIMLPLFSPARTGFTILWIGFIAFIGLLSQIGLYVYCQRIIARLVESNRAAYVGQLREKIDFLIHDINQLTSERYSEASPYISLYEKVMANTKEQSIGATRIGYFVRAFLLPIIAFVLNGGEILNVVNEIIKSIFAA